MTCPSFSLPRYRRRHGISRATTRVEFPHRIDPEQVPAYPLWRSVNSGCVVSDIVHAVNREAGLIGPFTRDPERGLVAIGGSQSVADHNPARSPALAGSVFDERYLLDLFARGQPRCGNHPAVVHP